MATWQYDIHLIPRNRLVKLYFAIPEFIDCEKFSEVDWWLDCDLPESYRAILDACLPRYKHWHCGTLAWGDDDGNVVAVMTNNEKIEEVFIRVDVRDLDPSFLECVCKLALASDCLILTMEGMKIIGEIVPKRHLLYRYIIGIPS